MRGLWRVLRPEELECSPWFREGLSDDERQERIRIEADTWWHLKAEEAARRLIDCTLYCEAAE